MTSIPQMQEYKGNCHCGAFKYELKLPTPGLGVMKIQSCDCSICSRTGSLWVFGIPNDDLVFTAGEDSLQTYKFGSKQMIHDFCPKCGSSVMVHMDTPTGRQIGINAVMLQDVDLKALEVTSVAGSLYGADYQPPTFPPAAEIEKQLKPEDGMKIYNGNCHCGAVTYSVLTKSLEEQEVMSCNCSLCSRNGDLFIYPPKSHVLIHTGESNLTPYAFLSKDSLHCFCNICSISVLVKVLGKDDICPVNIRTLEDFAELKKKGLKFKYFDGAKKDPQYAV